MSHSNTYESEAAVERPAPLFLAEGLTSVGTNLLVVAIYFYTARHYHWDLQKNLLLATGQGVLYVIGALIAGWVAGKVERHIALGFVYAGMALLAMIAFLAIDSQAIVAVALMVYSFASAIGWPIIESLASSGLSGHALSRRIGHYNTVWSMVSIVTVAGSGTLIERWPAGIFIITFTAHSVSSLLMFFAKRPSHAHGIPMSSTQPGVAISCQAPGVEPELLQVRTLALWLSRVALPAAYVVLFSLSALMPSLPVVKMQTPMVQTIVAGVWMMARGVTFVLLGVTTWWHTRPRLLLLAALIMLVAFFGITVRPSDVLANSTTAFDLPIMVLAQIALGIVVGMIYTASLYFGMVLSDGSTEHGGYHEALIGAGFIVGPGAGVIAQLARPDSFYTGIAAVGGVVMLSVVAVAVTSILARQKQVQIEPGRIATDNATMSR